MGGWLKTAAGSVCTPSNPASLKPALCEKLDSLASMATCCGLRKMHDN